MGGGSGKKEHVAFAGVDGGRGNRPQDRDVQEAGRTEPERVTGGVGGGGRCENREADECTSERKSEIEGVGERIQDRRSR